MKKFISLVVCLSFCNMNCTPAAWQDFKSNPAAYVSTIETNVQTLVSIAAAIMQVVLPLIPLMQRDAVQNKFTDLQLLINHAEIGLNDALKAAADAKSDNPDMSKYIADIVDAANQLVQFIDTLKAMMPAKTATAYSDLHVSLKTINTFH